MTMIYSVAADFSTISNAQDDAWSYRYKEDDIRDGNYQLIESFESGLRLAMAGEPLLAVPGPNAPAWQVDGDTPWVAMNTSGSDQTLSEWGRTIQWPADALIVHPGEGGMVVIRWRSPVNGHVGINYTFTDAYPSGGGDGIAWFVELTDAGQTLASGVIERGGSATGDPVVTDVEIAEGDCINFVVDSKGDHRCDWTRVDAVIAVTQA